VLSCAIVPVSVTLWLPLLVELARPVVSKINAPWLDVIVAVSLRPAESMSPTESPDIARLVCENAVPTDESDGTVAVGGSSIAVTVWVAFAEPVS
jgi:hypothetical protein